MATNYPSSKTLILHPTDPNKFLLIRQEIKGEILYTVPGGRLDADFEKQTSETFEEAAIREAKEEVGLDVELIKYIGNYYFFWIVDNTKMCSCIVYLAKLIGGEINTKNNPDKDEHLMTTIWCTKEDIKSGKIKISPILVGLEKVLLEFENWALFIFL